MKPPVLFALALILSIGVLCQDRPREQNPPEAPRAETTLNVPTRVDFQGRLAGSEGQPVNANLLLTFCLYDVATGGTALWCESQVADVVDGLFQVKLGVSNPLYPNLLSQPNRWIGITIESEPEMIPRTPFSSVGYALQAAENDPTWNGNANESDPISRSGNVGIGLTNLPAILSVGGSGSNPAIPGSTSAGLLSLRIQDLEAIDIGKMAESPYTGWIQAGFNLVEADPLSLNPLGGYVGIGTNTPSQLLDVNGTFRVRGHLFDYNNTSGTNGQVLTRGASGVLWQTPAASPWLTSGSNIYFNNGNVGIGTTNPLYSLDVRNEINHSLINLKAITNKDAIIYVDKGGVDQYSAICFRDLLATKFWIGLLNNDNMRISTNSGSLNGMEITSAGDANFSGMLNIHKGVASGQALLVNSAEAIWFDGTYFSWGYGGTANYFRHKICVAASYSIPTQMLDVDGNARFRAIGSGAYVGVVNRTFDGTLTTSTSDIRLKENIHTLEGGLDKVLQLRGVSFTWKDHPEYGTRIGFIAQEFEPVIPELVFTNEVDGYKGINYAELSAVLVEAVKEQQAIIEAQQQAIDELLKRIEALESK